MDNPLDDFLNTKTKLFRRKGSLSEPMRDPEESFLPEAQTFLDLLAVSYADG